MKWKRHGMKRSWLDLKTKPIFGNLPGRTKEN
jgi:hypothetical protein